MILFDRLMVSEDGKKLLIDTHVNKAEYFNNIVIDKVIVKSHEQVSEADPLSSEDDNIYEYTAPENTKELHLVLNANTDFTTNLGNLSNKLLFVYVVCKGTVDPCIPCRLDEMTTLGVTFDTFKMYQNVLGYTKGITDSCDIPKEFVDFIILWDGFKAAIETEHYLAAISFWKKLQGDKEVKNHQCNCHG